MIRTSRRKTALCILALAGAACTSPPSITSTVRSSPVAPPPDQASLATIPAALRDCELLMGWDPWEPYQYRDIDGELKGLDIELVSAIVTRARCKLDFQEGSWADMLPKLQEGALHLLSGATRTPARERYALFSEPYRRETWVLYVRAGAADQWDATSLESLLAQGFRVGVTDQYYYGDEISALQDDERYAAQFVGAEIAELNFARLSGGRIDGFLEDPFVAAAMFRRKGLHKRVQASPIELSSGEVSMMFSRASVEPAVVERIDRALAQMKEDGSYERIVSKYRN